MHKILIVGGGEIGRAILFLLDQKGIHADIYDRDPARSSVSGKLEDVVFDSDIIFIATPAAALPAVIPTLSKHAKEEAILVLLSKGFVGDDLIPTYLKENITNAFVLMGGPLIAEEIFLGKNAYGVAASSSSFAQETVLDLFSDTALHVERGTDVEGVALCGLLKNVYAVFMGIVFSKDLGKNSLGEFFSRSVREMMTIMSFFGVEPDTLHGRAGLGDFAATSQSPDSLNFSTGVNIGKGEDVMEAGGVDSLSFLIRHLGERASDMPVLNSLKEIIIDGEDVDETLAKNFF